jgi:hypothetical protein
MGNLTKLAIVRFLDICNSYIRRRQTKALGFQSGHQCLIDMGARKGRTVSNSTAPTSVPVDHIFGI